MMRWHLSKAGKTFRQRRTFPLTSVLAAFSASDIDNVFDFELNDVFYKGIKKTRLIVKCKKCGCSQERSIRGLVDRPRCFACKPFPDITRPQRALGEIVKRAVGGPVVYNDCTTISPYEIDVFLKDKGIGFELDGLYWHSSPRRQPMHSELKRQHARERETALMFFFEDEVMNKQKIVESIIKHKLGLTSKRINARECELVQLVSSEKHAFFETNHLDGDARSSIALGLKAKDGTLVAAMSLRTPFHKKRSEWLEIARFACALDTHVMGALSRLTRHALDIASSVRKLGLVSYVDTRFGDGRGYEQARFKLVDKTSPRFWWTDGISRFNRFKFRADREHGLSEKQVASAVGVSRIYGCSNLVFELAAPPDDRVHATFDA